MSLRKKIENESYKKKYSVENKHWNVQKLLINEFSFLLIIIYNEVCIVDISTTFILTEPKKLNRIKSTK